MQKLAPFYFLRHGQTDWNKKGIYMGSQNIPLNEEGQKEAQYAANILKKEEISCIFTSPLSRAQNTAQIISHHLNIPYQEIHDLRECNLGLLEGQSHATYAFPKNQNALSALYKAEPFDDLCTRVSHAFQELAKQQAPYLVVSHGGIYAVLCHIMDWPKQTLHNCSPLLHIPPDTKEHPWQIISLDPNAPH